MFVEKDNQSEAVGETSQEEINAIYAEVDGKAPKHDDEDISEGDDQKSGDDSQPADEQKEDKPDQPADEPKEDAEEGQPADDDQKDSAKGDDKEGQPKDVEPTKEEIEAWAIKHKVTFDEAKDDIKATKAVLKNYKTPEEIARALRSTQSAYDQLKNSQAKKEQPPVFQRLPDEAFLAQAKAKLASESEEHVNRFRERFPAKSELMSDEAIIEELAERGLEKYKQWASEQETVVKTKAETRRTEVVSAISNDDAKFVPEVKELLKSVSDSFVLSEDFDVEKLLSVVRGKYYHADIKAAVANALKRGSEKPEIVGAVRGSDSANPKKSGSVAGATLNKSQKSRAEEMFPDLAPEKAWSEFVDTWKDELKKDRNFIN